MPERRAKASSRRPFRLAIIGGGKVGQVLGRLMAQAGHDVRCVVTRTPASARTAGRFIGCRRTGDSLSVVPSDVNLLFLSVPHAAIGEVAADLATLDLRFRGLSACHMSGMLSAAVLAPLAARGARTFSFHPLQTFPRDFPPGRIIESVRGIYYGVDGSEKSLRVAARVARILGGSTLVIPPEMRELYHAACVVASNHFTAMLFILEEMFAGIRPRGRKSFVEVFSPIIEATLRNVGRASPAAALSGPVARGGVETVKGHLQAVKELNPGMLGYFTVMTGETLRLAIAKGSVTGAQVDAMKSMLRLFETSLLQESM